jgi:hypothetical protein
MSYLILSCHGPMCAGIVGDWKNYFAPSMLAEMDDVVQREAAAAAPLLVYE